MARRESEDAEYEVYEFEKLYKSGQWSALLKATESPQTPEQLYFRVSVTQGLAFQEIKQFDDSVQCFRSVYQFRAAFPDLEYNLGLALFYKQDYDASVKHFENYLRAHPTNISVYHETAMVLYVSKRWQDVLSLCEKAKEWKVKRPPYRLWALALLQLGQIGSAHRKALAAIRADAEDLAAWVALGDVLMAAGYEEEALTAYRKAKELIKLGADEVDEIEGKLQTTATPASRTELMPPLLPPASQISKPRHSMCDWAGCNAF